MATKEKRREEKKKIMLDILQRGLGGADPHRLLGEILSFKGNFIKIKDKNYNLEEIKRIWVIGFGKGAPIMGKKIEEALKDRLTGGMILTVNGYTSKLSKIKVLTGNYPEAGKESLKAAENLLHFLEQIQKEDLVIVLISGGGASVLEKLPPKVTLNDMKKTTKLLIGCDAKCEEINSIQQHLSLLKGGGLLKYINASKIINIILLDAVNQPPEMVALGPTLQNTHKATFDSPAEIFKKYKLSSKVPKTIINYLKAEKRKKTNPAAAQQKDISTFIIGDNKLSAYASCERARQLGYNTLLYSTFIEGEAKVIGKLLADNAKEILLYNRPIKKPACIVASGKSFTKDNEERNMKVALAGALEIKDHNDIMILTASTDGVDSKDACGAIVDGNTYNMAKRKKINPDNIFKKSGAYALFKKLKDLVITGPNNTDVCDLYIVLVS